MTPKQDAYERVTNAILERLDAGTVPWPQPWMNTRAMSASTGRPYRGLNTVLLSMAHERGGYSSPYWATYRKLGELGAQVRKGERSTMVTFWKFMERTDAATETTTRVPFLRLFNVFNVEQADWADGMPAKYAPRELTDVDPIAEADTAIARYIDEGGPRVNYGGDVACYAPASDRVSMPVRAAFGSAESFYAVHFHELVHSTGHPKRLNREGITGVTRFGSPVYSREELVAELGAAMLCATVGIDAPEQLDQRAAYIDGWRRALRDDPKCVVWAAGRAQRASDHVLGVSWGDDTDGGES